MNETEKIAAAALRAPGGRIYTGTTHAEAQVKIVEDPALTSEQKVALLFDSEDGFLTTQGRFVSREEAFQIAHRQKQMIAHPYAEPEANKKFYQGDQPKLDSGLLKEYAPLTCVGRILLETQRRAPAPSLSSRQRLAQALTRS